jgi:hypothetical protein
VTDRPGNAATALAGGSQVGSHHRPTAGYAEPTQMFDSCKLAFMERQSAIPGDIKNLVRIEVPVSSVLNQRVREDTGGS